MIDEIVWLGSIASLVAGLATGAGAIPVLFTKRISDMLLDVCAALGNAGLPVPNNPWQFHIGTPKVVVMIMPDGTSPGMLEDLCLRAIRTQAAMQCVNQYFTCLTNLLT